MTCDACPTCCQPCARAQRIFWRYYLATVTAAVAVAGLCFWPSACRAAEPAPPAVGARCTLPVPAAGGDACFQPWRPEPVTVRAILPGAVGSRWGLSDLAWVSLDNRGGDWRRVPVAELVECRP